MILEQISLQEGDRGVEKSLNIYKNKYKRNRDTRNSLIFAYDINVNGIDYGIQSIRYSKKTDIQGSE